MAGGTTGGGVLSTSLYKAYINDLLVQLREQGSGMFIGPIYVGSPTCADDMLMVTNTHARAQEMTDITSAHSSRNRYTVHPIKTTLTTERVPKHTCTDILLGDKKLQTTNQYTHLGVECYNKNNSLILEERAEARRRTVYSLMPAGLHREKGLWLGSLLLHM